MEKENSSLSALATPDLFDPTKNPFPAAFPLPSHLNPFKDEGVEFVPILPYGNLSSNIKIVVAKGMLDYAWYSEKLKGVHTLVEATSGNTGVGLGLFAPHYGIKRVLAIVERDTPFGKLEQLRLFGVKPDYPDEGCSTIEYARRLGEQPGHLNLGQYHNDANPRAHENITGPYIWDQTCGEVTLVAAGLGTGGTAIGVGRYLKKKNPDILIVGVVVKPGSAVPGVRTMEKLQHVGLDWKKATDGLVFVDRYQSYLRSRQLCVSGWVVGPSSGFAFDGALQFVEKNLPVLKRNRYNKVVVAFVCGDDPKPYMDKYSTILEPDDFLPLPPM